MVEIETEKGDNIEVIEVRKENGGPVLRKEPSFSRWCDEDGIEHLDRSLDNVDSNIEEINFELPLLQGDGFENGNSEREIHRSNTFRQRSMHLNGGHVTDNVASYSEGNVNGNKFAPFNVERGTGRELQLSELSADGAGRSVISVTTVLKTLLYILVWYLFSTCLTVYNKTLLGDHLGKFPAPMLMNTVHFVMQAILSNIIVRFSSQRSHTTVTMSWRDYFIRVVPTAIGTALDVNLSNASLVFISVTFATMCKSASPIFLLVFAFMFKLESPSWKLLGIILVISMGVLLTVAKDTEFEFWGFVFVMLAAVMSGFRWSMTQILLQKEAYGLKDPLTLMSSVTPVMAVATALFSLIMDPWKDFKNNVYFNDSVHILRSCLLMLLGGALAFFMVLTEFFLVSETSAVTVTIAGVVKEAVTILVAVFYFHDQFTLLKGGGLVTIMVGVVLFNWYKYQKLQKGHQSESDEESRSSTTNVAAKYVILDNMDEQNDDA